MSQTYSEDQLRQAVANAVTWPDVHRALGVSNSGPNYRLSLRAACDRAEIDTGHLANGRSWARGRLPTCDLSTTDAAYIAGLFDGEGCILISWPKAGKNGRRYRKVAAKITQKDRMILDWIRDQTGFGSVSSKGKGGPYEECFDWIVAYRQCEAFLQCIRPHVRMKLARLDEALGCYDPAA